MIRIVIYSLQYKKGFIVSFLYDKKEDQVRDYLNG